MSTEEFDRILRHTLADFRLSRGEKRTLANIVEQLGVDEQQLGVLRHRAFEIARQELLSPEAKDVVDWLEDVAKVLLPPTDSPAPAAEAYFSPGDDCPRKIANLLQRAKRKVDVCVFTITDDRITDALVETHDRGVPMRIITDDDKASDRGSDVDRLRRRGIALRVDRSPYHMHHKFAIFDNRRLLTGSYNWTRGADKNNEENLIVSEDPRLVRAFCQTFDQLWEKLENPK